MTAITTEKEKAEAIALAATAAAQQGANAVPVKVDKDYVPIRLAIARRGDVYDWKMMLEAAAELVEEEEALGFSAPVRVKRMENRAEKRHMDQFIQETPVEPLTDTGRLMRFMEDKIASMEASLAQNMDKLHNHEKDKWTEVHQKLEKMSTQASQGSNNSNGSNNRNWDSNKPFGGGRNNNSGSGNSSGCFYCGGLGHYISDCKTKHDHIDQGKCKVVDTRTCFFDGKNVPREPKNKTQAVKVEEYWTNRNAGANMFTEDNNSNGQNVFDNDDEENYDPRPDEIRTLKAERLVLSQQLLQYQKEARQAASSAKDPTQELMAKVARLESYVQTRARKGGAQEAQDSGDEGF